MDPDFLASLVADIEAEACRQEKVLATYGKAMQSSEAQTRIASRHYALLFWGLSLRRFRHYFHPWYRPYHSTEEFSRSPER